MIDHNVVDKDVLPRNSQFSFSFISGNSEELFELDPSSHLLTVVEVDSGSPAQTGTASVLISVEDVNDSPPSLDEASLANLSLLENSPPNTLVARLLPTDPDLPPNTGPFTFSISGGRELRSLARLDRESPEVTAASSELQVEVTIRDGGSPAQQASYPLTVVVEDENDNPSVGRTISLTVQTLQGDPDTSD